jgi:hypothetical protein
MQQQALVHTKRRQGLSCERQQHATDPIESLMVKKQVCTSTLPVRGRSAALQNPPATPPCPQSYTSVCAHTQVASSKSVAKSAATACLHLQPHRYLHSSVPPLPHRGIKHITAPENTPRKTNDDHHRLFPPPAATSRACNPTFLHQPTVLPHRCNSPPPRSRKSARNERQECSPTSVCWCEVTIWEKQKYKRERGYEC